jgi:hypothetical protein
MPTPQELAMAQQYAGNDFQNQDWTSILKAVQGFNPDQYDGGASYGMGSYTGPAIPGSGGWTMDEYQPGGGVTQLTRQASNQGGMDGSNRRFDTVTIGADGKPVQQWMPNNDISDNGSLFSNIVPLLGAALAAGGLSSQFGAAGNAASDAGWTSGYDLAGGSALPTGAEAAAATPEWVSAENGAGYLDGASADAGDLTAAANASGDYANEWNKLVGQQAAADSGTSLLQTGVPFTDLSGASSGLSDVLKTALTPSNIAKVAAALKGAGGASGGGMGGAQSGGFGGGIFNQVANETPGMIAAAPSQSQNQQLAQALLLGDSPQPKFSPLQFNPIQLAQALQDS